MSDNLDFALSLLRDHHGVTQVAYPSVDLNLVVKELLEGGDVEDLV